ncbi:hypothetical protein [Actinopolyspora halophila]|uniref:hypothetical protein n=1 Tax=Actinopolyspora halophila TaxID=1850 RepID=UPI000381E422|nr:hypothetical protein [Actinopolyspora halophila]
MRRARPVLAAAAAAALAGCGSTTSTDNSGPSAPPATTSSPTSRSAPVDPSVATVDRSNPTAVSDTVLTIAHSIDTRRHDDTADALLQARPLLTADYAANVATAARGHSSAQWRTWRAHQAHTRVQLSPSPEDTPADTEQTAHRAWQVTRTPLGDDGWTGTPTELIALVTLTATTDGWAVSEITYRM